MTDVRLDQLAEQALDRNDYSTARELYRKAALVVDPNDETLLTIILSNSCFATKMDHLLFLRTMADRYPESLTCGKFVAWWHNNVCNHTYASIWTCNQILARYPSPGPLDVHCERLRAALRDRSSHHLVLEDCAIIWESAGRMADPRPTREYLLEELASAKDPALITIMGDLVTQSWVTTSVRGFLEAKIAELKLLSQIKETNATS